MYIIDILYAFIFLIAFRYIKLLQLKDSPLWVMPSAFILKSLVGIVFLSMYLHPNTHNLVPSDAMRFLSESKQLHDVFFESPKAYFQLLTGMGDNSLLVSKYLKSTFLWDSGSITIVNDSRNIIRLHSIIHFISFGSPFVHCLFMCFLALIGLKQLHLTFVPYTRLNPTLFFFILLLLPSAIFWTSGILKEPLLILGLGLFIRSLLHKDKLQKKILLFLIGLLILISIKPYVLTALLPAAFFFFVYQHLTKQRLVLTFIICTVIGLILPLIFNKQVRKGVQFLSIKQSDFRYIGKGGLFLHGPKCNYFFEPQDYKNLIIYRNDTLATLIHPSWCYFISSQNREPGKRIYMEPNGESLRISYFVKGAQSYIELTPINNSSSQLVKNIPEAISNSYARPFPSDPGSGLKIPAMIEVWGLSSFLLWAFFKKRKLDKKTLGIIISLLIFAFVLFLIIGWTTPVIGAIFRYRFPGQLALLLVGLILLRPDSLLKKNQSE